MVGGPGKKGDTKRNMGEIENKFCGESSKILASWKMWAFSLVEQWRNQGHVKILVSTFCGRNSCLPLGDCLPNISLVGSA